MLARLARIRNTPFRVALFMLWSPIALLDWLRVVAINDPAQLLTLRPYAIAYTMFLVGVDGHFSE